jgi:hypothetical protein
MTPLLLFLLAIAAVYVGIIETAFSALMRLSLRLMADRGGRDDRLGFYLDDPIQLFVPARVILGILFSLATMCIAILTGRTGIQSSAAAAQCRRLHRSATRRAGLIVGATPSGSSGSARTSTSPRFGSAAHLRARPVDHRRRGGSR